MIITFAIRNSRCCFLFSVTIPPLHEIGFCLLEDKTLVFHILLSLLGRHVVDLVHITENPAVIERLQRVEKSIAPVLPAFVGNGIVKQDLRP
jgi:hypothetical protein